MNFPGTEVVLEVTFTGRKVVFKSYRPNFHFLFFHWLVVLDLNDFKENHLGFRVSPWVSDLVSLNLFPYLCNGGKQHICPHSWWLLLNVKDTIYERVAQGSTNVHSPECHFLCYLQTWLLGYFQDRKPSLCRTNSSNHSFNEMMIVLLPRSSESLVDYNFKTRGKTHFDLNHRTVSYQTIFPPNTLILLTLRE